MDKNLLEVREFLDPGYRPVKDFAEWRVAILNYLDEIHLEQIGKMERHNETDKKNSRYALLDSEQRHLIISASRSELSRRNGRPPRTKKFLAGRSWNA
jgi:hypothetical protein